MTEALGDTRMAVDRWQKLARVHSSSELDIALYSAVFDTIEGMTRCARSSSEGGEGRQSEEDASYGGSSQELLVCLFGDGYTLSCCGRYVLTQRRKPFEAKISSPLLSYKDTRNLDILKQIRDGKKPIALKVNAILPYCQSNLCAQATLAESNVDRVIVEDRLPSTFAEYVAEQRQATRNPTRHPAPATADYSTAFVRRKRLARFSNEFSAAQDAPSKRQCAGRSVGDATVSTSKLVRQLG